LGLLCLLIPFQNCGKQMKAATYSEGSSSAQCKAVLKAEALASFDAGSFECGNFNHYACDRRIFSPNVDDLSHQLKECVSGGQECVDVEVRQFSTAGLKSSEDPALFAPGEAYNREEIRCHHRFFYEDVALFEGEGESLEEALAAAMKACDRAGEPR
jgi:hypothetical protein